MSKDNTDWMTESHKMKKKKEKSAAGIKPTTPVIDQTDRQVLEPPFHNRCSTTDFKIRQVKKKTQKKFGAKTG